MLIYTVGNLTAFGVQCDTVILWSVCEGIYEAVIPDLPIPAFTESIKQPSGLFSWYSTTIRVEFWTATCP